MPVEISENEYEESVPLEALLPPIVQSYVNIPDPPVTVEVSVTDCPESMIAEEGDIETDAALSTVTVAESDLAVAAGFAPDVTPVSVKTK